MKRKQLREWYGKRSTPWSTIIALILIIAFGIFLALSKGPEGRTEEQVPPATEVTE
jgi:hypothetical protein